MSNTKDYDFTKLYKNRLEQRLVEYLETVSGLYDSSAPQSIQAQVALASKSIENIALMMAEQGYVNNRGIFQRFSPSDLLTIQQALTAAIKLRADIMMQPVGLEALTKHMSAINSVELQANKSGNPNTGLSEPPPLVAVDSQKSSVEEEEPVFGNIKEEPEVMVPVLLPTKIKS